MESIIDNMIQRGLSSKAKIILPELEDSRIKEATDKLISIGYNIVNVDDYTENHDSYLEMLSKNIFKLLNEIIINEEVKLDLENEIIKGCLLTHNGEIVHEMTKNIIKGAN